MATAPISNSRVDWRNYDYSEGPPRKLSASTLTTSTTTTTTSIGSTRDINPYSKRPNVVTPTRDRSSSSSLYNSSNSNSINSNSINSNSNSQSNIASTALITNNQPNGNAGYQRSTTPKKDSFHLNTSSSSSPEDEYLKSRKRLSTTGRLNDLYNKENDKNKNIQSSIETSTSSLTYRPAKAQPIPIDTAAVATATNDNNTGKNDDKDEEECMRIPKVMKYAHNLPSADKKNEHPFDHKKQQHHVITPPPVTTTTARPFEEIWREEDGAAGNARQYQSSLKYKPPQQRKIKIEEQIQHDENVIVDNDNEEVDDDELIDLNKVKFDNFACDRGSSSTNLDHENENKSSSSSMSDASVAKIDNVPIAMAPVSILRSSGRFDGNSVISVGSNKSSKSCSESRTSAKSTTATASNQNLLEQQSQNDSMTHSNIAAKDENSKIQNSNDDEAENDKASTKNASMPDTMKQIKKDKSERRSRRRDRMYEEHERDDDDDTSISDIHGMATRNRADTLKDRTKQAWSARNKATVAATVAISDGSSIPHSTEKSEKREKVSFQKDASIHEFTPEPDKNESGSEEESEYTEDDATEYTEYTECTEQTDYFDDDTYAGRSMHSMYTKSNESEAEDMIKDFLLIGKGLSTIPGKRQLKYKHGRREIYKDMNGESSSVEEDTTESYRPRSSERMNNSLDVIREDEDTVTFVYNFCEAGIKSLGRACGLLGPDESSRNPQKYENTSNTTVTIEDDNDTRQSQNIDEWYENASNVLFHTDRSADDSMTSLPQLALHAAKVRHGLRNIKYDETHSMNVMSEIEYVVLSVGIPVGIVFEESDVGVWVKKIFENGNTHLNATGDKVQVGDHLASINGTSAFKKSITDVCKTIAGSPDTDNIELTFLRYIGPLRSDNNTNENQFVGYEIIDPSLKHSIGPMSPVRLSKSLSNMTENSKVKTSSPFRLKIPLSPFRPKTSPKKKKKENEDEHRKDDEDQENVEDSNTGKPKKKKFGFFRRRNKDSKEKKGKASN
mmetsp:Transcript_19760/g.22886  ORF Transcript_19760/g.22886 Transcript_19760/m.22886 type:complete len:1013 (-) Transcript_19760:118-3156(-)